MKITKRQLRRIIIEERARLNELGIDRQSGNFHLAGIDQRIQPLKDMIEQNVMDDLQYDKAISALFELESILQKIAEDGSGAPLQ